MALFPFVQFEFTHSVGPPAGRYAVHPGDRNGSASFAIGGGGEAPETTMTPEGELDGRSLGTADVVVVQVRGAPPPATRRFRSNLPPAPEGEPPAEISVTVVTVVMATRLLTDESAARRLHASLKGSPEEQERFLASALAIVRRCVCAYRLAAADPYVPDLSPLDARAIRIGYGEGGAVVRGGWTSAFGVRPPKAPKVSRTGRLMPVQAMAAMLSGGGASLESEDLILSALRDLDHGRYRAAAVTLGSAVELLLSELDEQELPGNVVKLVGQLRGSHETSRDLARRALLDQLTSLDAGKLSALAEEAGALVDAWRYVPLGFG